MAQVLHPTARILSSENARLVVGESSVASSSSHSCVRLGAAPWSSQFWGISRQLAVRNRQQQRQHCSRLRAGSSGMSKVLNTAPWLKWWDKDGAPNMVEIHSMQEFIDALSNAGDRLVIVDFYARHCNGCRTLYPKLCKIAKEHPEVLFLKINYDDNTEICKALNVKVLPLFFVYRAQGHLESFSCTISKIQRLRDAIAKYTNVTPVASGVGNLQLAGSKQPAGAGASLAL
ncbi:thioredoxin-like 2, chloroplastic [Selaginella moellendorffii]|uniref:thioredoxin-like 2, chloroplastic n=1 Tax=Selaginella moellendorffii TaxID=88036 RepID=UPI000D1CB9E6|nr:thioredoxin-like 2, chloroplastic [Selaginella moellendorffii]|eukprot:XP_002993160.2 thioredoxin-like 2, chloroplastic [Selaginella moellendorffii]